MNVLIVLDDVHDSYHHIEKLLGTLDNFGSGSRTIVTTRDEQVLNANKIDDIYLKNSVLIKHLSFSIRMPLTKAVI